MQVRSVVVLSGATDSAVIPVPSGHAVARIVSPSVSTSVTLKIRGSIEQSASTYQPCYDGTTEYSATLDIAVARSIAVESRITKGLTSLFLRLNAGEGADRTFSIVFEPF